MTFQLRYLTTSVTTRWSENIGSKRYPKYVVREEETTERKLQFRSTEDGLWQDVPEETEWEHRDLT